MDYIEKTVEKSTIYSGKIISVHLDTVVLPNGRKATREIVRHPGGVGVVPVDGDGYVYLVKQYRIPYDEVMLEIPAGKLDKGSEDIYDAARRELGEETGLIADELKFIGEFYPTVGYSDENLRLFVATGLKNGKKHPDEDEFVSTEKYHISELTQMIMDGKIKDGKTIAAVLKAKIILGI